MSKPALVLIHGYPFDHTMWTGVVAALEDKATVIAPDLPGFGDNPAEKAEPSIDVYADAIAKLLDLHQLSRAVVAGMSMGGYVALAFAERHPARLAGLALVNTQAGADAPEAQQARRIMIEKVRREGISPAVEAITPKLFSESNRDNEKLKKFPRDGAQKAGPDGICWALEAMARRPDRTATLRSLSVPGLVIHGTEDKIIPAERARQMSAVIPDSKYVELSCGHASPLESPREVAAALLDLLQRAANNSPPSQHAKKGPGIIISPTERGL